MGSIKSFTNYRSDRTMLSVPLDATIKWHFVRVGLLVLVYIVFIVSAHKHK